MFRKKNLKKIEPNKKLFIDKKPGIINYKPLMHKNGRPFTDIEYFELLGRKAIELDKLNKSNLPTDYGDGIDRDTVEVAKNVVNAIDNGISNEDITKYLSICIDLEQ